VRKVLRPYSQPGFRTHYKAVGVVLVLKFEENHSATDGSICSVHGAEIEVESRVEAGSCFRVSFPGIRRSADAIQIPGDIQACRDSPGRDSPVDGAILSGAPANAPELMPKA
jgi:hypothetical protein